MASFSPQQKAFIGTYARATGLNPGVVAAQVAAEEPVGASSGFHGTQNWLNIGITDSGPMGAGNPAWRDPVSAAQLSAQWVKGQTAIPGFGRASSGIQAIPRTAGQSPQAQISALQKSGWASSGYPGLGSLYNAYRGTAPPSAAAGPIAGGPSPGGPSFSSTGPSVQFDQAAFDRAKRAAIAGQYLAQSARGASMWQTGPKSTIPTGSLIGPGLLSTKTPSPADYQTASAAQTSLQQLAGGTNLNVHPGSLPAGQGDVNPLAHGWTLGRTDQGVDASAAPGTPILAIHDSVVRQVVPNWYNGQPLVLMQLTAGPNAGKYWYVSEQIAGIPKVGQRIARGQIVARYADQGTGIEIGWGSPTSSGRTLAQEQGPLPAGHANTPAGAAFRQQILHA